MRENVRKTTTGDPSDPDNVTSGKHLVDRKFVSQKRLENFEKFEREETEGSHKRERF